MGMEIAVIGDGKKAAQLLIVSDTEWTSTITVQGHQRVNVGIRVGTAVSDILSHLSFSAVTSVCNSIFSGVIYLQRRMPEETEDFHWRDVASWSISSSAAGVGGSENITAYPEPETCQYRLGTKSAAADYVAGVAHLRLGTS